MNKHISCPPRNIATISGYLRICEELEAENQALRRQNIALRARLAVRLDDIDEPDFRAFVGRAEQVERTRLM